MQAFITYIFLGSLISALALAQNKIPDENFDGIPLEINGVILEPGYKCMGEVYKHDTDAENTFKKTEIGQSVAGSAQISKDTDGIWVPNKNDCLESQKVGPYKIDGLALHMIKLTKKAQHCKDKLYSRLAKVTENAVTKSALVDNVRKLKVTLFEYTEAKDPKRIVTHIPDNDLAVDLWVNVLPDGKCKLPTEVELSYAFSFPRSAHPPSIPEPQHPPGLTNK